MRSIARHQNVCSVSQTSREHQFRARPPAFSLLDAEMDSSALISPGVVAVVEIVFSSAIAGNRPDCPIVSAEVQRLGGRQLDGTDSLDDLDGNDETAFGRGDIHGRGRTISRID